MKIFIVFFSSLVCFILPSAKGHGRLIEPPSRASAWRYGFDTPHNYNDHELFCGGFTRQWAQNDGKCGVCGDAWDAKRPRPHEYGGIYGQGVIVRKYAPGAVINIRVELTANHQGYFTFSLCPDYKKTTQYCLDRTLLTLVKPQAELQRSTVRYYPKEGNKVYEMKYRLPKMSCDHCVLQWRYIAGNNWGRCPNGTEAIGCGAQEEFRACADITISGKNVPEMTPPPETTPPVYIPTTTLPAFIPTTTLPVPTELPIPEESYNPIVAIIISVITFLVVSLILFLLYIHYYQIGGKVKGWIKGDGSDSSAPPSQKAGEGTLRSLNFAVANQYPMPPPRTRRGKVKLDEDGMQEINLKDDSVA